MIWPTFCIDNFFQNADAIVDYANNLEFKSNNGAFPGTRTEAIHEIDNYFFSSTTKKILACLYPNEIESNLQWTALQYFQKIDPKKYATEGFIHQDLDAEFTSIIYLNETNSNTCIYRRIKEPIKNESKIKYKAYKGQISQKSKTFKNALKRNNQFFEKTIEFKAIKNRMILFDGGCDHGVESFGNKNEPRLTLITFFERIIRTDNKSLKYHANECRKY